MNKFSYEKGRINATLLSFIDFEYLNILIFTATMYNYWDRCFEHAEEMTLPHWKSYDI